MHIEGSSGVMFFGYALSFRQGYIYMNIPDDYLTLCFSFVLLLYYYFVNLCIRIMFFYLYASIRVLGGAMNLSDDMIYMYGGSGALGRQKGKVQGNYDISYILSQ